MIVGHIETPPRRMVAAAVALLVVASACSDDSNGARSTTTRINGNTSDSSGATTSTLSSTSTSVASKPLRWRSCGAKQQCSRMKVPLTWSEPDGATIDLALYRRVALRSSQRIGSLLTNPGGPGVGGEPLVANAPDIFTKELRNRFDIVTWDPRGTGDSTKIDCGDDLDAFFAVDRSPDSAEETADNLRVARDFVKECERRTGALLTHVGTNETVRDMDAIRAALGDEQLTFIGFSYGTFLGAAYARQFPDRVRALVLDGAVDPSMSAAESTRIQAVAFEASLNAFLSDCTRSASCRFRSLGDAPGALAKLLEQVERAPIRARVNGEERLLGPTELRLGIATMLYPGENAWPDLAGALESARQGRAAPMLRAFDDYTGRERGGSYSNEQAAFVAIACADGFLIASESELIATASRLRTEAPFLGPDNAWLGSPCPFWPVRPRAISDVLPPKGLGKVLVVSTTNDPATPYEAGVALARQLNAALLTLEGDSHTAYDPDNACVTEAVDEYLFTTAAESSRCG